MRNEVRHEKPESSSEKINYLIRPTKQVERKLIIEALQRLKMVYAIGNYQYVGMGSLFYVDYQMFHKYLGIKDMISMEMEEDKIDRFDFNKPYDFIELLSGISTDVLPTLDWEKDMFIWLDYDSEISQMVVADIQIVCSRIKPGGILLVTIDAKPERFESPSRDPSVPVNKDRLENFKKALYPYHPFDIRERNLTSKEFPSLLREIMTGVIKDELIKRKIRFFQIFNFKYKDTSPMYTFGCIFEENPTSIKKTGLFNLDFVSKDSQIIEISLPIITPLEKMCFDQLIPNISEKLGESFLNKEQLNDYEKYYKYYPRYFESLL